MAIFGIGTDICHISRIEETLQKYGHSFIERLLTKAEQKIAKNLEAPFIARRFAAKEAVSKALGTGIGKNLSFQDFEIARVGNEAPTVIMHNKAYTGINIHLSISDEKEYAVAFVVAEK
ncbi:MAG: holo-[acyl-carrier protein] synthase [Alphaproteobacteria bacterium]|jgi:holo-[acyl-carrier protein] synthase